MAEDPWSMAKARDTTTGAQHAWTESYPRDPRAVEGLMKTKHTTETLRTRAPLRRPPGNQSIPS